MTVHIFASELQQGKCTFCEKIKKKADGCTIIFFLWHFLDITSCFPVFKNQCNWFQSIDILIDVLLWPIIRLPVVVSVDSIKTCCTCYVGMGCRNTECLLKHTEEPGEMERDRSRRTTDMPKRSALAKSVTCLLLISLLKSVSPSLLRGAQCQPCCQCQSADAK